MVSNRIGIVGNHSSVSFQNDFWIVNEPFPMNILSFQLENLFCQRHLESPAQKWDLDYWSTFLDVLSKMCLYLKFAHPSPSVLYKWIPLPTTTFYWRILWARVSERNVFYPPSLVDALVKIVALKRFWSLSSFLCLCGLSYPISCRPSSLCCPSISFLFSFHLRFPLFSFLLSQDKTRTGCLFEGLGFDGLDILNLTFGVRV